MTNGDARRHSLTKWLVVVAIILGALLLSIGGLTVAPPSSSIAGAYLADRNFPLAALLLVLLVMGRPRALGLLVATTAVIHALDTVFDVGYKNSAGVAGSVVFAVVFALAASWLFRQRQALWRSGVRWARLAD